ncbi:MAG: AraC family transcriptional regulator [Mariniphaga sp.]|nr:AraC family transcriptional regulator [Mariniphaga sp.]
MKKEDGFPGQISFVLPEKIIGLIKGNPLISDLYLTDIGYYPQASHHFRERPTGSAQFILIYCIEGQGEIRLGETSHLVLADHYFIIPAGMTHAYHSDVQNPWSIYWIHFSGAKAGLFARQACQCLQIDRSKTSRISDRIDLFAEILRNLDRGFSIETLEYINLCLNYLLASFTHLSQFRLVKQAGENDPIAQSINFMLENLRKKLKLGDIARETGLSASHYSRLFLNRTGHPPIDYFIQLKIQRACRLLDNSGWTIADVSRETGFDDQFYFSRVFRKVMDMSPAEYRKRRV